MSGGTSTKSALRNDKIGQKMLVSPGAINAPGLGLPGLELQRFNKSRPQPLSGPGRDTKAPPRLPGVRGSHWLILRGLVQVGSVPVRWRSNYVRVTSAGKQVPVARITRKVPIAGIQATEATIRLCGEKAAADKHQRKRNCKYKCFAHLYLLKVE